MTKSDARHLADIVGEWGKWQFLLSAYAFLWEASAAFINMGYSFHAKSVDYWCADVPHNHTIITDVMKCNKYNNPNESCSEWQYNRTQFSKSIVTEFDLVCDRQYFASLTQSAFMMGYIVSGFVVSYYSDKYGRRPMIWMCFTIEVLAILSCALSYNIYQYLLSRFLVGLGHSGSGKAIHTILFECCGPKHRADITMLTVIGWILGYILLPVFAFWLQDFRYMQSLSAIPLILMLIWFYFMYESPRWQLANGQLDKAEITIEKACKLNGISVDNLKIQVKQLANNIQGITDIKDKSTTILDLLKTPNLRKYTLILWYSWIVMELIYYGISFNMTDFGGNFYITFALAGLMELPSQLLTPLFLKFIGRRKVYAISMIITAVSCIAVILATSSWIRVLFACISKFTICCASNIIVLFGSEVYPTVVRHIGTGAASVMGRIGSVCAPFMGNLTTLMGLSFVMTIYGVLSLVGAILGLSLPETKGREIPDTLEEAENL